MNRGNADTNARFPRTGGTIPLTMRAWQPPRWPPQIASDSFETTVGSAL